MAHLLEGLVGIASWRAVAFQHGAAEVETAPDAGRESAKRLRARDANLLVRCGEAEAVLHGRHKAYSIAAVHAHEETGFLWTYTRDKAVRRWAKGGGGGQSLRRTSQIRRLAGSAQSQRMGGPVGKDNAQPGDCGAGHSAQTRQPQVRTCAHRALQVKTKTVASNKV
jgi:hypothetical protein